MEGLVSLFLEAADLHGNRDSARQRSSGSNPRRVVNALQEPLARTALGDRATFSDLVAQAGVGVWKLGCRGRQFGQPPMIASEPVGCTTGRRIGGW